MYTQQTLRGYIRHRMQNEQKHIEPPNIAETPNTTLKNL